MIWYGMGWDGMGWDEMMMMMMMMMMIMIVMMIIIIMTIIIIIMNMIIIILSIVPGCDFIHKSNNNLTFLFDCLTFRKSHQELWFNLNGLCGCLVVTSYNMGEWLVNDGEWVRSWERITLRITYIYIYTFVKALLKMMIFLFQWWDMWSFPGGYLILIVLRRLLEVHCGRGFGGGIGVAQQENMLSESGSSGSVGDSLQQTFEVMKGLERRL